MLNRWSYLKPICSTVMMAVAIASAKPASSQLLPQGWVSVGSADEDISYAVGARLLNYGVEVGTGEDGATGVDALRFITVPFVSPYVGIGFYSGDETVAYSGGVQFRPQGNLFFGAGYHSLRGINGQLGVKF